MKKLIAAYMIALVPMSLFAQSKFTAPIQPPSGTVSQLPTASSWTGGLFYVTDGASATDCTTGSGSTKVLCQSNGTSWAAIGGSGGGGTRTITLSIGGGSFAGAQALAWSTDGTGVSLTTTSSLRLVAASLTNSGTPYLFTPFWLPADYSSGLTIQLMMIDSSGAGGHVRFNYGLECQTSAAAFSSSFTNTATSADTTLTGFGNQQLISATSLATSGCSAGQLATLKIERDNSVGSNMAGNAQIYAVKLSYTSSY